MKMNHERHEVHERKTGSHFGWFVYFVVKKIMILAFKPIEFDGFGRAGR
jgi:hypothetical protein